MKKSITTATAALAIAVGASAEVSTTFDFASAYVFRGYTFNDGLVFQPGIEAAGLGVPEAYGAVAVGAWANYDIDDYDGNVKSSEFSEVDWYVAYSLPSLVEGVDLSVGYTEYTYPLGGESDKEFNAGVGFGVAGVSLGATVYYLTDGEYTGDTWYEASAGYEIEAAEGLTVGLAADVRFVDSRGGETGFNDYTLGASASYALSKVWSIGASVAYIGQIDDEVLADTKYTADGLIDGEPGYDVDFVGTLSLSAVF